MTGSPYLTSAAACEYLGLPSLDAFYQLRVRLKAKGTPLRVYRVERRLRFKRTDLDRLIQPVSSRRLSQGSHA